MAQLKWAITLWERGCITIEKIENAKGGTIKFKPQKNPRGNETTAYASFSWGEWGPQTLGYLASANALSGSAVEEILELAEKFVPKGRNTRAGRGGNEDDPRAHLLEGESSADSDDSELEDMPGWGSPVATQHMSLKGSAIPKARAVSSMPKKSAKPCNASEEA